MGKTSNLSPRFFEQNRVTLAGNTSPPKMVMVRRRFMAEMSDKGISFLQQVYASGYSHWGACIFNAIVVINTVNLPVMLYRVVWRDPGMCFVPGKKGIPNLDSMRPDRSVTQYAWASSIDYDLYQVRKEDV